jgi:hypothetical protein
LRASVGSTEALHDDVLVRSSQPFLEELHKTF